MVGGEPIAWATVGSVTESYKMTDHKPRKDEHAYTERTVEEAITGKELYHDEDRLRGLYFIEGLTQREIADKFGVDPSTITYWFKKHDIPTRPAVDDEEYGADRGDA